MTPGVGAVPAGGRGRSAKECFPAHLHIDLLLRELGQKASGDAEVKKAIALNPKLKDPARTAARRAIAPSTASPSASPSSTSNS